MGYYAENFVAVELRKWKEAVEISYYREGRNEVDFVVTYGGAKYLPIEVSYRHDISNKHTGLVHCMNRFRINLGVLITKETDIKLEQNILVVPLRYFLLLT
jgi:predicted AAA+ superfamily ATPase